MINSVLGPAFNIIEYGLKVEIYAKKDHYEKLKRLIQLNDPELLNKMIMNGDLIVAKDIIELYQKSRKNKYFLKNETTQQFEQHVLNFKLNKDLGTSPKVKTIKI